MHRLQDPRRNSRKAARLNNAVVDQIAAPHRDDNPYRGRFAPSPSGPLHFGSVVTALGSYLQARRAGGQWLVRIEDLDTPRNQPGAVDEIQRQLDALGLVPDDTVIRQSTRRRSYQRALDELNARSLSFPCACSRADLTDDRYPGTCRHGMPDGRSARSIRVRAQDVTITVRDGLQPTLTQNIERDVGDFVVRRADNIVAYHLAVVVDDAWQQITEIVRGADLLDSTPRQIYLQQILGLPTPRYVHLPLAIGPDGAKLSKQNGAAAIEVGNPARTLLRALDFLGQSPPPTLATATPRTVLEWATANWSMARVPVASRVPSAA